MSKKCSLTFFLRIFFLFSSSLLKRIQTFFHQNRIKNRFFVENYCRKILWPGNCPEKWCYLPRFEEISQVRLTKTLFIWDLFAWFWMNKSQTALGSRIHEFIQWSIAAVRVQVHPIYYKIIYHTDMTESAVHIY